jgi:tetratricopeptide (TPR) repeat protein
MEELQIKETPVIGLIMIVRNESNIILRCLESTLSFIDFISICVNNTTDDTEQKITKFMKENNIPGKVYHHIWKNFGHNRTLSFRAGVETAVELGFVRERVWLLTMDADHVLCDHNFLDKSKLSTINGILPTAYMFEMKLGSLSYKNIRLMHASYEWICVKRVHEVWRTLKDEFLGKEIIVSGIWIRDVDDGGNKATKYHRELRLLFKELRDNPDDPRCHFYIGQLYRIAEEWKKAINHYKKCSQKTWWDEEKWYCFYAIGTCFEKTEKWDKALFWYMKAYQERPSRSEPLHKIAKYYRQRAAHHAGMIYATAGVMIPYPVQDILFVESDVYLYQFYVELGVMAHYVGKSDLGLLACEKLRHLPISTIDQSSRQNAGFNLQYYVAPLACDFQQNMIDFVSLLKEQEFYDLMNLNIEGDKIDYVPMNPSIVWYSEQKCYLVNLRFVNYYIIDGRYIIHHKDNVVRSRNFILVMTFSGSWKIKKINELILSDKLLPNEYKHPYRGLEDCRIFLTNNDRLWFSCTSWEYHHVNCAQICLCNINLKKIFKKNSNKKKVDDLIISFLVPLASPFNNQCEKNWLPFYCSDSDKMTWLYDSGPYTTIISIPDISWKEYNMTNMIMPNIECRNTPKNNLDLRDFRGSASPVWIITENLWLYVIHEVLPIDGPRKYVHRFVSMDSEYNIIGFTYPFYFSKLEIEYVCGMSVNLDEDLIILTLGRMDREGYILSLSLKKILSLIYK